MLVLVVVLLLLLLNLELSGHILVEHILADMARLQPTQEDALLETGGTHFPGNGMHIML